jgi:predicted DNA-binding WGR domain protein
VAEKRFKQIIFTERPTPAPVDPRETARELAELGRRERERLERANRDLVARENAASNSRFANAKVHNGPVLKMRSDGKAGMQGEEKQWQASIVPTIGGIDVVTKWGRVGYKLQAATKSFTSNTEANMYYGKLYSEKRAKGYK